LTTPAGRCLLQWEQARLDQAVADAFGFHALQLGLPGIAALRANRMPHRWVADPAWPVEDPAPMPLPEPEPGITTQPPESPLALCCDFDALPFPSHSVDLVVMPHALELARDAHLTLREVERVLVAEGRLVITGFNPASLWMLRQRAGRLRRRLGMGRQQALFMPGLVAGRHDAVLEVGPGQIGEAIGHWRLRDWLRLLGFEIEVSRFGLYGPPVHSERWIERMAWMERMGDRWWPVFGAAYLIVAVKRVRGMRLVGMARREGRRARAPAAVINQQADGVVHRE
jgi:SAM-dependent methyltransferase